MDRSNNSFKKSRPRRAQLGGGGGGGGVAVGGTACSTRRGWEKGIEAGMDQYGVTHSGGLDHSCDEKYLE